MTEQAARHLRIVVPPAAWTAAMEDGSVQVPGLTWETAAHIAHAPERFVATREQAYDVGENGLRRYIIDLLDGAPPTAIPVFFSREYMHRNLLVREDSPLSGLADLAGKRIGSRLTVVSGTGAAVLMMLEQAYGVDLLSLKLHMDVGRFPTNRMGLDMQPGPETDDVALSQLLGGDLDAVIMTTGPRYYSLFGGDGIDDVVAAHPGLRTLVTEPDVIVDAYRRTGLYPISDVVVLRRELVDEAPEAPAQLVDAFSRANALAGRHRDADEQRMADRELALLDRDPYGYELGPDQRLNLKAYTDFFYRMGAIERPLEPEELFVPSTLP
ncbi:MAG: hypothetical protein J4N29_00330 [Chloroflexi bacterium]|nr:hypothetical protein [Chloroflexota bacterium]MCI0815476.1 hypothetical protein [Chloroflexota bacterium]